MWIFTQTGYISVVDKGQRAGHLTARSRDKQSLAVLSEIADSTIEFTPMADYEYRTVVERRHLAEFLIDQVDSLEYSNFKDQIWQTRGNDFHHACGDVWVAMNGVKDKEAQDWYADRYTKYAAKRGATKEA